MFSQYGIELSFKTLSAWMSSVPRR
ncbi:MAG: hypothetical protein LPD71_05035 [Shewanella sp.]|nr:hypothetical protein [Shewanella sp.]MCF1431436.1 hypothetical protein [Shewanella sp.]MCF1438127.1 hypothetical protein [Shewanella sp.]MCF1457378.1 hypothetical protein [Shewanella sp.]